MYIYIFVIIGFITFLILKISFAVLNDEKNISAEDKITIYKISGGDFSNVKTYEYEDIPMFRDLPFKDDYYMAFYVASQFGLSKNKSYIVNVILLKWIKDGNAVLIDKSKIKLVKEPDNDIELELYKMMKKNCKDDILNSSDFKWFCKENNEKVSNWLANTLINQHSEVLNNKELIEIKWIKDNHIDGHYEFIATDKLNELALKLAGLKKFFHCLTSLGEKQPIEVALWRDYLIYAEMFGVAYAVSEKFEELYNLDLSGFANCSYLDMYVDETIISAFKELATEQAIENGTTINMNFDHSNDWKTSFDRAFDYSSGGGGFSSGGGGGDAFGGGGGGGGSR